MLIVSWQGYCTTFVGCLVAAVHGWFVALAYAMFCVVHVNAGPLLPHL